MSMKMTLRVRADAKDATAYEVPRADPANRSFAVLNVFATGSTECEATLMYPDDAPLALVEAVRDAHNAVLAAVRRLRDPELADRLDAAKAADKAQEAEWDAAAPTSTDMALSEAHAAEADAAKLDAFVAATEAPPVDLNPGARVDGWTLKGQTKGQNPGSYSFWTFAHNVQQTEVRVAATSLPTAWAALRDELRRTGRG